MTSSTRSSAPSRRAALDLFRLRLADTLRLLSDPAAIQAEAARLLGEQLGVSRVTYGEVTADDKYMEIARNHVSPGVPPLTGRYRLAEYGMSLVAALRAGESVVVPDVASAPALTPDERAAYTALGIAAFVSVPLIRNGRFTASLNVHHTAPRTWSADDLIAIEDTAERTWAAAARARAHVALRESEARFRALATASADVIYRMSADWRELRQLYGRGLPPDTCQPRDGWLLRYVHPDDRTDVMSAIARAVRTRSTFEVEHRVVRADGTIGWTHSRAVPLLDDGGDIVEWVGAASDITQRRQAEAALRESGTRLHVALSAGAMGTWQYRIASDEQILDPSMQRLVALPPADAPMTLDNFLQVIHPDDRARVRAEFDACIREGREFDVEFRVPRPDGSVVWLKDRGRLFRDERGRPLFVTGAAMDITDRRRLEDALRHAQADLEARVEARNRQLADVMRQLVSVQEEERRRIARDLHDDLGQKMTALHLKLAALGRRLESPDTVAELRQVQDYAQQLDRSVRFFAGELRSNTLYTLGLDAALHELAENFTNTYRIGVDVEIIGRTDRRLRRDVEVNLYRIAQEAMQNAHKHGHATQLDLILLHRADRLVLTISDDGTGFDTEITASHPSGLGLIGMRERAALVGGQLDIESAPGEGTSIVVAVPFAGVERRAVMAT